MKDMSVFHARQLSAEMHRFLRDETKSPMEVAWRLWEEIRACALTPEMNLGLLGLFAESVADSQVLSDFLPMLARDLQGVPVDGPLQELAGLAIWFPAKRAPNACVIVGAGLWWSGAIGAASASLDRVLREWPDHSVAALLLTALRSGWEPTAYRDMVVQTVDDQGKFHVPNS